MKAPLASRIFLFSVSCLLFAVPTWSLDFHGEWWFEMQQNVQRKNYWLQTPGTTMPEWNAIASLLAEIQGEWHPRLHYNFRGEAIFQETEKQFNQQFRLIEGALHYEINPLVFLDVGKILKEWGTGYAFNPLSVLIPPENPSDRRGNRPGVTLLKLEMLLESMTLSAILAGVADENTAEQVFAIPDSKNKRRIAFKVDHTFADLDLSWIHVQGGIDQKSLEDHLQGSPLAPQLIPTLSGIAWNTVLGESLEIHGEIALQRGRGRPRPLLTRLPSFVEEEAGRNSPLYIYQYDYSEKNRLFSQFLIGGQFTFSNGFNLAGEWFYHEPGYTRQEWEHIRHGIQTVRKAGKENSLISVKRDPYSGFLSQTQLHLNRSTLRQNYIFLRLFSDRIATHYESESILLFNLDDSSYLFRNRLDQFQGDDWTFSMEWSTFLGFALSEFGLNPYQNQVTLSVSYLF